MRGDCSVPGFVLIWGIETIIHILVGKETNFGGERVFTLLYPDQWNTQRQYPKLHSNTMVKLHTCGQNAYSVKKKERKGFKIIFGIFM